MKLFQCHTICECVQMDVFRGWKGEFWEKRVNKSKDWMAFYMRFDYLNDLIK